MSNDGLPLPAGKVVIRKAEQIHRAIIACTTIIISPVIINGPDRQAVAGRVQRNREAKEVTSFKVFDIHILATGIAVSNGGL